MSSRIPRLKLYERQVGRAEALVAIAALAAWTPAGRTGGPLHPGDVGWHLRFEDDLVRDSLRLWSDQSGPVAVTLSDGPVLYAGLAPRVAADRELADMLAWRFHQIVGDGQAWCALPEDSPVGTALLRHDWTRDPDEPWVLLVCEDLPVSAPAGSRVVAVDEDTAPARVAVQRAAFEGSTFTVERWRAMRGSVAASLCVESLVLTPDGQPAAAATGWLAAPGRCALLEPVGTHPEQRGHGYGRAAVRSVCARLRAEGASAVAVLTPATNTAAVALYRSAGFREVAQQRPFHRPLLST
ncbi:GNAT family N-acetyltransferase [Catellatospora tritici]|uniref:GNAT family N-acetyltransferase n=1 Tax=Catellatospora tritici TaxID=2851566 RepID=UPI001C2DC629|nr:N-acetyltransferase [Catellatospora tritici]MBV1854767.1 GNAT family N-acetyltransferase [Catellatospora tritici]